MEEHPDAPLLQKRKTVLFDAETGLSVPFTAVLMVFVCVFIDGLGGHISNPSMPYYAKSFAPTWPFKQIGNAEVGYLFSMFQLTGMIFTPILGRASDRFGRRRVLLVSLIGAGTAALGQGLASNFPVLMIMRGFSGVWGGVMAAAKVYIADVSTKEALTDYMGYLASVPGCSQTFGPGLGGGLAKFGLRVPLLVDGTLSFVILILVYFYLPESPAWLEGKLRKKERKGDDEKVISRSPIPASGYLLGISTFFYGMGMFCCQSMLAVVLNARFNWDPLHVGYCLVVVAIFRLASSLWIAGWVSRAMGMNYAAGLGAFLTGILLVAAAFVQWGWLMMLVLAISRGASAIRSAVAGSLSGAITDSTNRGKVFSMVETFNKAGKLVGPIVGGHLATIDADFLPFIFSGVCVLICSLLDVTLKTSKSTKIAPVPELDSVDEVGTAKDFADLGEFVGRLLTARHYKWLSKKESVKAMLDNMIPELGKEVGENQRDFEMAESLTLKIKEKHMRERAQAQKVEEELQSEHTTRADE